MLRTLAILAVSFAFVLDARCEEFAEPPEWSDEIKNVFFDDAREALSGEPSTPDLRDTPDESEDIGASPEEVWADLIDAETLMSAIRRINNDVGRKSRNVSAFKAGVHLECRRDMTLLGTLYGVVRVYPGDIRWKESAPRLEQLCFHAAESCVQGTDESHATLTETLTQIFDVFRGQPMSDEKLSQEQLTPEFAPLMQSMEEITEHAMPVFLGKQLEFRKRSDAAARESAVLAVLSQVIRSEEFGFADDETYQAHADNLREAAQRLHKAALAKRFQESVDAAAVIGQACAKCHADYRG